MKNLAPNGKPSNLTPKQYDDGGLIIDDNIKLFGLNNYTKSKKSGKFYKLIAERKINDKETENWWIYFTIKDGKKTLGVLRYRFENEEKDIYNEKIISLSDLPKSLLDIYNKFELGGSILLAPNGKPSKLTPEQYKLVRTPAFKKWFGDWENDTENASKVVDENGEPLVVYHGTNAEFYVFEKSKRGSNTDNGIFGKGFYLSKNLKTAQSYGAKIIDVYINIINPFRVNDFKSKSEMAKNLGIDERLLREGGTGISALQPFTGIFSDAIKENGHDGVITKFGEYVVFEPNQIKLADGTNTTFDGSNPDIRYANGGEINNEFIYTIGGL
jgi:hypothetical protein